MTTFEITSPQGAKYRVEGPQGATEQDAMRILQRQLAGLPGPTAAPDQPVTGEGIAKAAGIGLAKGAIGAAAMQADVGSLALKAGRKLGSFLGLSPETMDEREALLRKYGRYLPGVGSMLGATSADIQKKIEGVTGEFYEPQNRAERYTESVASFLPSAAAGPGGAARRVIGQAVIPGVASEAAGESVQGTKYEKYAPWIRAAAAAVAPAAASRLLTPFPAANPARQQAVRALRDEGVTEITAGQATGNKRLRYAESELGGSTAERTVERQQEQFTQAALRRIGVDAPRATADVIDNAFTRIGGQMDQLASRTGLIADRALINDLVAARDGYANLVAQPMQAPIVQNVLDRITNSFTQHGMVPGQVYQSIRSDIGRAARGTNDPQVRHALYEIQGALDANAERIIQRNNPRDLGAWRQARREYRNLLVIERAANYAGEAAASGLISPANLARATKAIQQSRNYARGRGDFTPLARAGVEILSSLPNSGTAQRLRAHSIPAIIAAALGGTAGSAVGPHGTAGGIAAGLIAPRAAGEAILSPPGRRYLGNQLLERDPHPYLRGAARALVGEREGEQRRYGGTQ